MASAPQPNSDETWLSRVLGAWTRFVIRFPLAILLLAAAAVGFCGWFTAERLEYHTSRLHLLNPESDFNKLWLEYIKEFGDEDDVIVVVHGSSREEVLPLLDELAARFDSEPDRFRNVLHKIDLTKLRSKGLYYLPPEDLRRVEEFLRRVGPILHGDWSQLNVGNLLAGLNYQIQQMRISHQPVPREEIDKLSESLLAALGDKETYRSPLPSPVQSAQTQVDESPHYLLFAEGQLGIVLLQLVSKESEGFASGASAIDRLRAILKERSLHLPPGAQIGLTGLPVMENDEMRASQETMTAATLLSLLGVAIVFWAGFGGWRHMILSMLTLVAGMVWSFGFVTSAVGHLNILSVSFAVILIGLGIDFGIHYCARYLQLRSEGKSLEDALHGTSFSIGPGMVTGLLTTAAAFYVASFTEFTGVAELGIIAGGGIILCGLATFIVLPPLIRLADRRSTTMSMPQPLPIADWVQPLFRWQPLLICLGLGLTGASAYGLTRLWYDHNLLNLQPAGLESVVWEKRLLSDSNHSAWYALSVADTPEELLARKEKFLALPSVVRVEEVVSLVPADHADKLPIIERMGSKLDNLTDSPPVIPVTSPEELAGWLDQLGLFLADDADSKPLIGRLKEIRRRIFDMSLSDYYGRCARFQQHLARDVWERLYGLQQSSNPNPPDFQDLPPGLVSRFVGKEGRYLLKIFAKGDIWDMDKLEHFVRDVRTVDARATGKPLQTFEASRQMMECYKQAAVYALIVIAVLLMFDFWSIRDTLLGMLPLSLGVAQMFGILGLLGIPINPANIVALPVILGIGVDNGVHVVHEFRRSQGRYRLSNSLANSMLLCSLTTIIGFGSLMIADHRGIESLGRVMVIGTCACFWNAFFFLPSVLGWITRHRAEPSATLDIEVGGDDEPTVVRLSESGEPARAAA